MTYFVLGKLIRAILVIFTLSLLTYLILDATPGSVAASILGPNATPEEIAELERSLGLDRSVLIRYLEWLGGVVSGDLGISYVSRRPVGPTILAAASVTFPLIAFGVALSLSVAVISAMLSARFAQRLPDQIGGFLTSVTIAVPVFVAGPILAYIFAVELGWLPVAGWSPPGRGIGPYLFSIALPVICIAISEFATYQRLLRADLIATLDEPFVEAARTRGISERRILFLHAFRPATIPTMTALGLSIGRMIGGTVVVENIFNLPGLGMIIAQGILSRDVVLVQGVVIVVASAFVIINTVIDIAYGLIDPRVRVRESA